VLELGGAVEPRVVVAELDPGSRMRGSSLAARTASATWSIVIVVGPPVAAGQSMPAAISSTSGTST
jgi:hypothetical protein